MKVIRKEPEQYDALKWDGEIYGKNDKLPIELINMGFDRVCHKEKPNALIIPRNNFFPIQMEKGEYLISRDNHWEVLSEKEFQEQYEVIK